MRQQFKEKVEPKLETITVKARSEIGILNSKLSEQEKENEELRNRIAQIELKLRVKQRPPFEIPPEVEEHIEKAGKEMSEYFETHKKEIAERHRQQTKAFEQWQAEHPKEVEKMENAKTEIYLDDLERKKAEAEKVLKELRELINNQTVNRK
jgi:transketolase